MAVLGARAGLGLGAVTCFVVALAGAVAMRRRVVAARAASRGAVAHAQ